MTAVLSQAPPSTADLGPQVISVQQRSPMAFLLVTPSGASGRIRSSEFIDTLSQLVQQHTDFFIQSLDANAAASCEGRLACITRLARPDYERLQYELGNGQMAPYSEHLAYLKKKKVSYAKLLMVLSNITGGHEDRMSLTVVDTDKVLQALHTHDPGAPDAANQLAVHIRKACLLAEPKWGTAQTLDAARDFLKDNFNNHLRRGLEASGHWEPQGSIELRTAQGGHAIQLDGTTVGATVPGLTQIVGVAPGRHQLALSRSDISPWSGEVQVQRRVPTTVTPTLLSQGQGSAQTVRQVLMWTGVGLVVAGTTVSAVALARQDSSVTTFCPTVDGNSACGGSAFISTGYDPSSAPSFGNELNPSGVLIGPLGYSLALTGAAWSLGTWLFGDGEDLPWWQLGAGVVLGATAYGISHALNPGGPVAN